MKPQYPIDLAIRLKNELLFLKIQLWKEGEGMETIRVREKVDNKNRCRYHSKRKSFFHFKFDKDFTGKKVMHHVCPDCMTRLVRYWSKDYKFEYFSGKKN
jgi:ribosomal protein L32